MPDAAVEELTSWPALSRCYSFRLQDAFGGVYDTHEKALRWLSKEYPVKLVLFLRELRQGPKENMQNFIQRFTAMANRLVAYLVTRKEYGNDLVEQTFVNNLASRIIQT
eukprot:437900-Hanusia_phi.AAC.1